MTSSRPAAISITSAASPIIRTGLTLVRDAGSAFENNADPINYPRPQQQGDLDSSGHLHIVSEGGIDDKKDNWARISPKWTCPYDI